MNDLLDKLDDVMLYEGKAKDYCWDYLQDCGIFEQISEYFRFYFYDEAYARDMVLNVDIAEFCADNTDYIVWGF